MPAYPKVFIIPEGLKYKPPKNWKPFVLILQAVLVIGGLSLASFYYRLPIQKSLSKIDKKPEVISQGKISDLIKKNSPILFYADLEYDPKTGVVKQLKNGQIKTMMPIYYPWKPTNIGTNDFIYRVTAINDKGNLIQYGWMINNGLVEFPQEVLSLKVLTVYQPNSLVKIYSKDNKLIWTGKVI